MSFKRSGLIAISLFGIGIVLGLTVPTGIANLLSEELAHLRQLSAILAPFKVSTALFIFLKNVSALLISFAFSPFLCLLPALALTFNGSLLSFTTAMVVQERPLTFVLAALLPHGLFELPALIIGEAAALSFGTLTMIALISKEKKSRLLPGLKRNLRYLILAGILLLPAAIIETYITPLFLT